MILGLTSRKIFSLTYARSLNVLKGVKYLAHGEIGSITKPGFIGRDGSAIPAKKIISLGHIS